MCWKMNRACVISILAQADLQASLAQPAPSSQESRAEEGIGVAAVSGCGWGHLHY